jgi:hypothetical protein
MAASMFVSLIVMRGIGSAAIQCVIGGDNIREAVLPNAENPIIVVVCSVKTWGSHFGEYIVRVPACRSGVADQRSTPLRRS